MYSSFRIEAGVKRAAYMSIKQQKASIHGCNYMYMYFVKWANIGNQKSKMTDIRHLVAMLLVSLRNTILTEMPMA